MTATYPGVLLRQHQLFARKELGQNFLADPGTAEMITDAAEIRDTDTVMEIGPGLGALTLPAARKAGRVIAVEKDARLIPLLQAELDRAGITNVSVVHQDVLKADFSEPAAGARLVVMGNLPYNISSQVLFRLVENRAMVSRAVLMFQKELAERIVSPPGNRDYGRLSVVMQYCAEVETVLDIPGKRFFPKPEVASRVIRVRFFEERLLAPERERHLFRVIKAAFSKRRKTLKNSLAGPELQMTPAQASRVLARAGIDEKRRAETLDVPEFMELARAVWEDQADTKTDAY